MKGGKSNNTKYTQDSKYSNRMLAVKNTPTKSKAANDPNKPKRPLSPFFEFMEDFRKQFQEENPRNKSNSDIGKAGGIKWKAMSNAEKAPYVAKSDKMKVESEKTMAVYNKNQVACNDDSKKSECEVKIEPEDSDDDDRHTKGGKSNGSHTKEDTKYNNRMLAEKNMTTKSKAASDPNKPKRPVSPFYEFMEDFKKHFQEENPHNRSIAAIGKAGGIKWKAMSDAEKAPYVAKYDKMKVEYTKKISAYNKKQVACGNDVSNKFISEVKKEEDSDDDKHAIKEPRPLDDMLSMCSGSGQGVGLEDSLKDPNVACVESSTNGVYSTHPPTGMGLWNMGRSCRPCDHLDPYSVKRGSPNAVSPSICDSYMMRQLIIPSDSSDELLDELFSDDSSMLLVMNLVAQVEAEDTATSTRS